MIVLLLAVAGSGLVLTQSSITAPLRDGLDWLVVAWSKNYHLAGIPKFLAKLVSCPMCAGFWLGCGWAWALGTHGVHIVAHGFAGSIASAVGVATWLALGEATAALGLWRYLNTPKDLPK